MNQFDPIFFTPDVRIQRRLTGSARLFKGKIKDPAAYQKEQEAKKEANRQAFYRGVGYNDEAQNAARDASYSQMEQDIVNFNRTALDKERENAIRQMRFNNARSGNSGGSTAADDQTRFDEMYQQALADIASKAKGAVATSRQGYESAFNRGLQQINAGADAQTQISSAMQDYANAMQTALEGAKGGSWGGYFGDLASTIDTAKVNAAKGGTIAAGATDQAVAKLSNPTATSSGAYTYK